MACDPETQAALTAARLAYQQIISGEKARVIVDQNGERVEFASGNLPRLYAEIMRLESLCGVAATVRPSGPVGFVF